MSREQGKSISLDDLRKAGPMAAAEIVFDRNKEELTENYRQRKESVKISGFDFAPYYNRPKKPGFGKLLIKRQTVGGSIYQELLIRDVAQDEAFALLRLTPEEAAKEHERRVKLPRYGFVKAPKGQKKQLVTA